MSTVPAWAAYAAAVGAPVGAFIGGLIGQVVTRKGAKELEARSRREQVMTMLAWAAEMSISDDDKQAALGLSQLRALGESNLSDPDVQAFVDAALDTVVQDVVEEVEDDPEVEIEPARGRVVAAAVSSSGSASPGHEPVQSRSGPDDESGER